VREADDHSQRLYGTGGIKPLFVSHRRGPTEHSPLFVYRWEQTRAALERLRAYPGSPYDGIIFEYVDPTTGGCVMPTMSFRCQLLRGGERTLPHRKTASNVYCVLEGEGCTEVEGTRLEWKRNDVFTVPGWLWHEHKNTGGEDAFLYSVTTSRPCASSACSAKKAAPLTARYGSSPPERIGSIVGPVVAGPMLSLGWDISELSSRRQRRPRPRRSPSLEISIAAIDR